MADFTQWRDSVKGKPLDIDKAFGDQCVDVVLNWGQQLYPNASYSTVFPPVPSAKMLFAHANLVYFDKIENDHTNANQLPQQGDILVFDPTPEVGFTNKFPNSDGHTGVLDHCDKKTYTIVMQDGSNPKGVTTVQTQPWLYRPCIGWLHPKGIAQYYTAVKGDTVYGICRSPRFNISIANDYAAFRKLNPSFKDLSKLAVGQRVRVK